MDALQVLYKVASQFLWMLPLLIVVTIFRLPYVKGYIGELIIKLAGKVMLDRSVYHPHHNVTLMMDDGTTQIDHIYVSKYGVFVIETKNMKGWIFGAEKQATWTQQIYKKTFKFQNPLKQNYRHTLAVKQILQVQDDAVHSVVAFVGDCQLKSNLPANVTKGIDYIRYIRSIDQEVFSHTEVDRIDSVIRTNKLASTISTHTKHIASLKKRHHFEDSDPACPRCQCTLVRRQRKKGAQSGDMFWGCSAFPKCRFTKDI